MVWVVCSVTVPWELVAGASLWVCPWWAACRVGCVWWRCVVGIGGGHVVLGVSVVPWGFVGGVWCLVVLAVAVSCHVVSCRVASRRVVLGHLMSMTRAVTRAVDMSPCDKSH